MAYSFARRRALQVAKLRAAGIDPGTNPRATWEALDPAARRYATTRYARRDRTYKGGGPPEARPAKRKPPTRGKRPFHDRKRGVGDIYWTRNWRVVGALLRAANTRKASILARLYVRDLHTQQEGWRMVWIGDAQEYLEVLDGPHDPVQLTIGVGGDWPSSKFRKALDRAGTDDGMEPGGRVPVMFRAVTNAGGFGR